MCWFAVALYGHGKGAHRVCVGLLLLSMGMVKEPIGFVLVCCCSLWTCAITKWDMWYEALHLELPIDTTCTFISVVCGSSSCDALISVDRLQ